DALEEAMAAAGEQHTVEADAVADFICKNSPEPLRVALRAAQARGASDPLPLQHAANLLDAAAPTHAAGAVAQAWASLQAYDKRGDDTYDRHERDREHRVCNRLASLLFEQAEDPTIRAGLFNRDRASMLQRVQEGDLRLVAQLERLHRDLASHFATASGLTAAELTALSAVMPRAHAALVALATDKATAVLGVGVGLSWADNPRRR
ncbi:MAG TPA: hypothetical protein VFH51_09520, partial [Myxococcota bacterium]|nr:hypothetical protein [Myxococcota bacterium]